MFSVVIEETQPEPDANDTQLYGVLDQPTLLYDFQQDSDSENKECNRGGPNSNHLQYNGFGRFKGGSSA